MILQENSEIFGGRSQFTGGVEEEKKETVTIDLPRAV